MEPKSFYRKGGLNHVEYRSWRAKFSTQGRVARTHVIAEAFVKRGKTSEFSLVGSLLRKVSPGALAAC